MNIDSTIVVQVSAIGVVLINGAILYYIKGVRDQFKELNGSVKNTRETYVPKLDCIAEVGGMKKVIFTLSENVRDSLKRMHERIDEIFIKLVDMSSKDKI